MANNVTKIQTVLVGSGGSSAIDFNSISGTYTDLFILGSLRGSESATRTQINLRFNGSSAGYYRQRAYAFDAAVAQKNGDVASSETLAALGSVTADTATASVFSPLSVYILNYANSSYYKSFYQNSSAENNSNTSWVTGYGNFRWDNSSAINSISIFLSTGSFKQYSSLTLYGIKNS
jgi:hypothetical protein